VTCLYAIDYGPADPAFDPVTGGGQLLRGFEPHASELARAQNLGQLQAMERQLQRGQSITWCDQGYSWVESPAVEGFLAGFMLLVVLPYAVKRLAPRLYSGIAERSRRWAEIAVKLANKAA
jgi:hypothetical protein